MELYDFDEMIDRTGTGSVKYDLPRLTTGRDDLIPLWVADMDFRTPDFITDALKERLEHPVFGYTRIPDSYFEAIKEWNQELHSWKISKEWIRYIPGIVKGIGMVLGAFLQRGDKVIIQPPVYHPFRLVPQRNGYEVVENPLIPVYEDGEGRPGKEYTCGVDKDRRLLSYRMDFNHLESIIDDKTKVLILANPHNPGGIGWDRETLSRLASIAARHDLLVISDEIHAEMMLGDKPHFPFASISEEAASHSITFMAPSKTFNLAGIVTSYTVVPDPILRDKFFSFLEANELDHADLFAVIACESAYRHGKEWRKEMLEYISSNISFVDSFLKERIPSIRCVRPEASFLVWLDCRSLSLPQEGLISLFQDKAGLVLNEGSMFGSQGTGFMRLNVACPQALLAKALGQLEAAIRAL